MRHDGHRVLWHRELARTTLQITAFRVDQRGELFLDQLEKSKPYLIACAGGVRSQRAAHYLSWAGYKDIVSLQGGTDAWVKAGLPLEGVSEETPQFGEPAGYQHGGSLSVD